MTEISWPTAGTSSSRFDIVDSGLTVPLDQTAGCAIVAIMILFVLPRRCWRYAGHLEGTLQAAPPGPPATFASCSARSVLSKDCVTTAFHAAASLLADYTDHLNIDTCGRRFACTTSLTAFLPTLPPVCMVDFAAFEIFATDGHIELLL